MHSGLCGWSLLHFGLERKGMEASIGVLPVLEGMMMKLIFVDLFVQGSLLL